MSDTKQPLSLESRPTPETDFFILHEVRTDHNWRKFARNLERQRDEAREQVKAMREVIKEAHENLSFLLDTHAAFQHCTVQERKGFAALAKLQPFITP